ncbi:hypothetical protein [Dyella sp. EPa41]|uniref:hypothetical protein n=1 Tax=Dyella sp. EPa41 TaxID=1561194 RepID=UPI001916232B|nr:hypothetical protein [Dyella sp. EPa41]
MRWAKILGLIVAGAVLGGLLSGYVVWQYMVRFGISWNQWASSQLDEQRASDALSTVAALSKLRAGNVENARNVLEWRLTGEIAELAGMKKAGSDPRGYTSKALSAISDYRQTNPWASGSPELDKQMSDTLREAASPPGRAQ